jgi:hypothetical protein
MKNTVHNPNHKLSQKPGNLVKGPDNAKSDRTGMVRDSMVSTKNSPTSTVKTKD